MVGSFASFHIIGEDRNKILELMANITKDFEISESLTPEEKDYHDLILLELGNDLMKEYKEYVFRNIWQPRQFVGVECNSGYSFFGSDINMDTLQQTIHLIFDYEAAPTVLGVAVKGNRFLRLCIYSNSRINADWLVDIEGNFEGEDYYRPRWRNMFLFENYFGITKKDFKRAINEKSVFDALTYIRKFIDLPIHLSYDDIIKNSQEYKFDCFF